MQSEKSASKDSDLDHHAVQRNDKITSLQKTINSLENQVISLQCQIQEVISKLRSPNTTPPSQVVQRHIRLLHDYNEIRDVGQGLLSLIAEKRGVRCKDVLEEFGVGHDD